MACFIKKLHFLITGKKIVQFVLHDLVLTISLHDLVLTISDSYIKQPFAVNGFWTYFAFNALAARL